MTLTPTQPSNIYLGSTECACAYMGSTLVRGTPPTQDRPDITSFSLTTSISSGVDGVHGLCCSDDGTNIYLGAPSGPISQFICSDGTLSTFPSSYDYIKSGIATRGMYMKSNGDTLFSVVDSRPYTYKAPLSTSYRIDTANNITNYSSFLHNNTKPAGCEWSTDGTYFYTNIWDTTTLQQYSCSTPRDLSTASWVRSVDLSGQYVSRDLYDIRFSPTGKKLYISQRPYASTTQGCIFQFNLSTAWDISTAVYYDRLGIPSSNWAGNGTTIDFCNNGRRLFVHNVGASSANSILLQFDSNS